MSSEHPDLRKRGDYGFDGFSSRGLAAVAAGSAACVALTAVAFRMRRRLLGMVGASLLFVFVTIAPFRLHATRRGKFIVWAELLEELHLRGDERVLDLGCGRGAVATMVAKLVPGGTVVGLRPLDGRSDGKQSRRHDAKHDPGGVVDRCQLTTGNMLALPFAGGSFDLIVSSLAIHNVDQLILASETRLQAINEAARVLKPGGRMLIVDLQWTHAYAQRLRELGLIDVQERRLGWQLWYGPWMGANAVTAAKPA